MNDEFISAEVMSDRPHPNEIAAERLAAFYAKRPTLTPLPTPWVDCRPTGATVLDTDTVHRKLYAMQMNHVQRAGQRVTLLGRLWKLFRK